jgi:hypothetical protein
LRLITLLYVVILAAIVAGQASAQINVAPLPITIGQTSTGTIGAEDAKTSDGSSYKIYRVLVPAGHRVTATMTSSAFVPSIAMGSSIFNGDCSGCIVSDHDSGIVRPAVVSRVAATDGLVDVLVTTLSPGEAGAFTLSVQATIPTALSLQPIRFGQSKRGALTAGDAMSRINDAPTDAYALRLAVGQRVELEVTSSDFGPSIDLLDETGARMSYAIGYGSRANTDFTAPRAGVYQVFVRSRTEAGMGAYRLRAGPKRKEKPIREPLFRLRIIG